MSGQLGWSHVDQRALVEIAAYARTIAMDLRTIRKAIEKKLQSVDELRGRFDLLQGAVLGLAILSIELGPSDEFREKAQNIVDQLSALGISEEASH